MNRPRIGPVVREGGTVPAGRTEQRDTPHLVELGRGQGTFQAPPSTDVARDGDGGGIERGSGPLDPGVKDPRLERGPRNAGSIAMSSGSLVEGQGLGVTPLYGGDRGERFEGQDAEPLVPEESQQRCAPAAAGAGLLCVAEIEVRERGPVVGQHCSTRSPSSRPVWCAACARSSAANGRFCAKVRAL